ncbi:MAG: hypothetical protein BroJett039_06280 [Chloroflexota bacterium]|nr:MAG: hypothetical protein BroJett039_06280 [Chloroflexota bacterium]
MSEFAIEIQNLGKRYRIVKREDEELQKRSWLAALGSSFDYLSRTLRPPTEDETLWALRDVSFNVKHGEVLGIIGRNGAGKSTLLKILSRITEPTEGRAIVRGRIGSLLEVGTGFHPDLTGRENVYFNGTILGMSKREIDRNLDEIVDFAEIEKFIDTPVKHYSSGMYVRLAFAVAAHLDPEILILDEVLSVGDEAFRKKCIDKMSKAATEGRTILYVSHNIPSVADLCVTGIWLQYGRVMSHGPVGNAIQDYLGSLAETSSQRRFKPTSGTTSKNGDNGALAKSIAYGMSIESVTLRNRRGELTHEFDPGDDLNIEIDYRCKQRVNKPAVMLIIQSMYGTCFGANMMLDGRIPEFLEGEGVINCRFKRIPLMPQNYTIIMAIRTHRGFGNRIDTIIERLEVGYFTVRGHLGDFGFKSPVLDELGRRSFPVIVPYEWTMPDGTVEPLSLSEGIITAIPE